jgi:hypothetical protein
MTFYYTLVCFTADGKPPKEKPFEAKSRDVAKIRITKLANSGLMPTGVMSVLLRQKGDLQNEIVWSVHHV